jgi:mannan endo-1,4-beta-mannosidase
MNRLWLAAALLAPPMGAYAGDFVTVDGVKLMRAGRPYHFVGTNAWYGANLALTEQGRARLVQELDLMKKLHITNLRVLGASEGPGQHNSARPQFKPDKDSTNEELLRGLDYLLDEMGERNMTAVIYLNNYWVWSGGMSQYMSWFTGKPVPNPFLEEHTWPEFMAFSAQFYAHTEANALYRDYIRMLVERKNSVNGRTYRDDPTIMAWQLSNEPRPGAGPEAAGNMPDYLRWIDETSAFIKSLDSNHLVSVGHEGLMGCVESEECYLGSQAPKAVDYMTVHAWIYNWSWLDIKNMEGTYPSARERAVEYLQKHSAYARQLGKPLVLEEFGVPRDGGAFSHESATSVRDRYFECVLDELYADAASGGPFAGSNFWAWGGLGRAKDPEEAVWRDGDDYVGDPPQEPQGLNSVFSSDESTLALIAAHGQAMSGIAHRESEE